MDLNRIFNICTADIQRCKKYTFIHTRIIRASLTFRSVVRACLTIVFVYYCLEMCDICWSVLMAVMGKFGRNGLGFNFFSAGFVDKLRGTSEFFRKIFILRIWMKSGSNNWTDLKFYHFEYNLIIVYVLFCIVCYRVLSLQYAMLCYVLFVQCKMNVKQKNVLTLRNMCNDHDS